MSNVAISLVSPRYRHFFPIAPQLLVEVKGLRSSGGIGEAVYSVIAYSEVTGDKQREYVLPTRFKDFVTPQINMYIDGIYYANEYGWYGKMEPKLDDAGNVVVDSNGAPEMELIFEYDIFKYDPMTESIVFTSRMLDPLSDLQITFEVEGDIVMDTYNNIDMRRYLIQGASPQDGRVVNPLDPDAPYFQGGYRCTLQLLSKPLHGVVAIAPDKLGFLYRPEVGYYGGDSFSYRIINCMGQESDVACLYLQVG